MKGQDNKYAIGIDVGGQTSRVGVVDADGRIAARSTIRTDVFGKNAEAYVKALALAVKEALTAAGEPPVAGIGIGAPNANHFTGSVAYAPNISWAADCEVPLTAKLSEALGGVKVRLTNDANAAAMGEMAYGAARGMKDFIEITLGTGLGAGVVCGGKLVYGHDGLAGELGHICAERGGRLCGCGRHGCLETYASATGVATSARERIAAGEATALSALETVTSKDVYEAAISGDKVANEIFVSTGTVLGRALADFVAFTSPEAIILFGGLTKAGDLLLKPVAEALEQNVMRIWKGKIKVLISTLNEQDAAILGASALGWN